MIGSNQMTITEVGTGRKLFEGKDMWQNAFKEELKGMGMVWGCGDGD